MKNQNAKSTNKMKISQTGRLGRVGILLLSISFSLVFMGILGSFIDNIGETSIALAQEEISWAALPVEQTTELIQNGDFESGLSGWTYTTDVYWEATDGHPNGNAIVNTGIITQSFVALETAVYRVTFDCVAGNSSHGVATTHKLISSDPNTATFSDTKSCPNTNEGWATYSSDILLLAGQTYSITFEFASTASQYKHFRLDNVSIQKFSEVEEIETGLITNGEFIGSAGWEYSDGASFQATGGMTTTQLGSALIWKAGGGWITQTDSISITGTQPITYQLSFDCISAGSYGAVGYHTLESSDPGEGTVFKQLNCLTDSWVTHQFDVVLTPGNTYTYSARYGWGLDQNQAFG